MSGLPSAALTVPSYGRIGDDLGNWAAGTPLTIVAIVVGGQIAIWVIRRLIHHAIREMPAGRIAAQISAARELAPGLLGESGRGEAAAAEPAKAADDQTRAVQRAAAISSVADNATAFFVWVIVLVAVLAQLGVDVAAVLTGAGVIGLALGFGAQSLIRDFFSGVFILIEDQFAVGDFVDLGEARGQVEELTLRTTRLRAIDGVVWHVPNGEIVRVGNMSQHWSRSLLDIEVAYETDLELAKRIIQQTAEGLADEDAAILAAPEVWGIEALGANGVTIRLVVKTRPSEQWRISRLLRERIKLAFDVAGVEIPFPQQVVWHRTASET